MLQCVLSRSIVINSWRLATPWSIATRLLCPWQECWSGLLFPPPRALPNPEIEPKSPVSPAAAAAKSPQSCPTLWPQRWQPTRLPRPWDSPGKKLEWVAISFSNACKWKVKVKPLSRVQPSATPWTAAYHAPLSMGFSTGVGCHRLLQLPSMRASYLCSQTPII